MREKRVKARTTVRSYQLAVRSFLAYVIDPVYGWDRECLDRFGTHAVQIAGPGNTGVHVTDYEGDPARRALTRAELQALFDAADDTVAGIRSRGGKGWLPAFRDATMLKVAYGWGLPRHELVMLEAVDWGSNPKAAEFGGLRGLLCALGESQTRLGAAAAVGADGDGMGGRGDRRVGD